MCIMTFENYHVTNTSKSDGIYEYYFEIDEFDFIVCIKKSYDAKYYWLAFKTRMKDTYDIYDYDIIVNKNPFLILKCVKRAIDMFFNDLENNITKYNLTFKQKININDIFDGFLFTLSSDNKDKKRQRLDFYRRFCRTYNYKIMLSSDNVYKISL